MNTTVEKIKTNLIKDKSILGKRLSECDAETQDILHMFESGGINGADIMRLYKKLQNIRKERRSIKIQIAEIDSVYSKLDNFGEVKSTKATKYVFKTDVVSDTLPKHENCTKGSEYKFKN